MIKVLAPNVAQQVLDWAIQAYGAAGVSDETPLATMWAHNRTLRIADGPDEVHRNAVAKLELAKHMSLPGEDLELPVTRS
jgi:acyl-CoA dehydrogenase